MERKIELYHCQLCGKLTRQEPGREAPTCCDQPMALAAVDTVRDDDELAPVGAKKTEGPSAGDSSGGSYVPRQPR